jgi:thiol-disulfide isomerase/thioredoxin
MSEDEMPAEVMEDKDDEMMSDDGDEMMNDEDEEMMDSEDAQSTMTEEAMAEEEMMLPEWLSASLTNAHTGETFTISDYKGDVVLVETLAMWCSNCLKQQKEVQQLHKLLIERENFVSVGIDIDANENIEALKVYTNQNGFDWIYTVASPEVAREIGQLYGDLYLNPPSTPMLIIDQHGEVHTLPFGIKSAADLYKALQPFLDGTM